MRTSVQPGCRGHKGRSHDDRDGCPSSSPCSRRGWGGGEGVPSSPSPAAPGAATPIFVSVPSRRGVWLRGSGRLPPALGGDACWAFGLNPPRQFCPIRLKTFHEILCVWVRPLVLLIANLVRNVPISRIWQHAATVKFSPGVPGLGGGVNISVRRLLAGH